MIVRELAAAIAANLSVGRHVALIVGSPQIADEYRRAVEYLSREFPKAPMVGTVLVLCADRNNGPDCFRGRTFDVVELCPSCEGPHWRRAQELAREAGLRSTPVRGKPLPLPRELRQAIRRGRRPKTATEKDG